MSFSKFPISFLPINLEGVEEIKKLKLTRKSLLRYLLSNNLNMSLDVNFDLLQIEGVTYKPLFKFISKGKYRIIGLKDLTHVHTNTLEDGNFDVSYDVYLF